MSEFTKNKIGFAVALLATLFTIYPVLLGTDRFSFVLFNFQVHVRYLYYCLALLLSCSVYFYGIQFITERSLRLPQLVGDVSYALALVAPPLYVSLYLVLQLAAFAHHHMPSLPNFSTTVAEVVSILLGVMSVVLSASLRLTLAKREKASTSEFLFQMEIHSVAVARRLYEVRNYDLCVIECFRAIEAALRKRLVERGILPSSRASRDMIEAARKANVISPSTAKMIDSIRIQRNTAAHNLGSISQETAASVLAKTDEILSTLTSSIDAEEVADVPNTRD